MCYNNKILVPVMALFFLSQMLAEPEKKTQPGITSYSCETSTIPFFVIILTKSRCAGSLITNEWVLTAAHCLLPQFVEDVTSTVHSGFDKSPQLKQVRNVKEFHSHPNFVEENFLDVKDLRYDIGLVLVDKPFSQTAATHVATLPTSGYTKQCSRAWAPGTGKTYTNVLEQLSLKCVNLSIFDTNACKEEYSGIQFDDTIMCTHEHKRGMRIGDSGGPLLCDDVVVGIVSYGPEECDSNPVAATYTKVENYHEFMDHIVKFSRHEIKYGRVGAKKTSGKSLGGLVKTRLANWKLIFFTHLFNWLVLHH